jgi:asparagine N-glycosylation enzyme membrane subunit Stt3
MIKPFSRSLITYTLIFLISASIGVYFRLYPLRTYTPQDASEKATLFVLAQLRQSVIAQVESKHPELSPTEKEILVNHEFNQMLHKERNNVRKTIAKAARSLEAASLEERPYPYLLAADSYYFYDLTEKVIENGSIGEKFEGSKFYHPEMLAPSGYWQPINLHPYIGAAVYRFMQIFDKNIDLMYAVSFTPLIITILTIVVFLIALAVLGCRPLFAFTGAVFFLLAPIYLKRSMFAWYDNDTYTALFAFAILAIIFHAFKLISRSESDKTFILKQPLILGLSAALLSLLYAFFWEGWVFLFGVLILSSILTIPALIILKRTKNIVINHFSLFLIFFVAIVVFIATAFGFKDFAVIFGERAGALKAFLAPKLSLWPDLFFTVGELQKSPISEIAVLAGGLFFVVIAIFGTVILLIKGIKKEKDIPLSTPIVLSILLATTLYLSIGAQRFTLLLLIPLALAFPLGLQMIFDFSLTVLNKFNTRKNQIYDRISRILLILLTVLTILIPIVHTQKTIETLPNNIYNDVWNNALIKIKERTPPNSIINTWWPPGHFIKAIADRRVTFDGATISTPQAYWMAQFFLTSDELTAVGILRMLNNSGNDAADFLTKKIGLPLSASVEILKIAVRLNPLQAALFYSTFLKDKAHVQELIKLTHSFPPPSYCMIYNEFVEGNVQLGLLGRWNFKKVEELNTQPEKLKQLPAPKSKEYLDFLWELVGGQLRYSGPLAELSRRGDEIIFPENIIFDQKEKTVIVNSAKYGKGRPSTIIYADNGNVIEKKQSLSNLSYSAVIIQKDQKMICLLMDNELARSMLTRLYYFEAKGLQFIKPFISESDMTNRTEIKVFEVDWNKLYSQDKYNLPK